MNDERIPQPRALEIAEYRSKHDRKVRPVLSDLKHWLDRPLAELEDRPIHLAFVSECLSLIAKAQLNKVIEWCAGCPCEWSPEFKATCLENRLNLPPDGFFIPINIDTNGVATVGMIYRRVPELDRAFVAESGESGSIQVGIQARRILWSWYGDESALRIQAMISPALEKIMARARELDAGFSIPIYDAFVIAGVQIPPEPVVR